MREPVDDHVVLARLAQGEGLDRHALDLEADALAADRKLEVELLDQRLEARGPAEVGAERQADLAGRDGHRGTPG